MKIKTSMLLCALALTMLQCNTNNSKLTEAPDAAAAAPKAFEEKIINIRSYERYEDVVDKLYEELVANDATLKSIEAEIKTCASNGIDLENNYNNYNGKSISFYENASSKTNGIKDSVLKHKLLAVLEKSAKAYEAKNSDIASFMKTLSKNDNSIKDKHIALKLLLSLKVMENFQKTYKPQLIDYSKAVNAQSKLIHRMDSITP